MKRKNFGISTQLKLIEPDVLETQTHVKDGNLMILGQYHIHIIKLDDLENKIIVHGGFNFAYNE